MPWHECDQHILTQGQFTEIGRRAVGQYVTGGDHVTDIHQRSLVHTGVLVRTLVFDQVVNIHTGVTGGHFFLVDADNDTSGIHLVNDAAAFGNGGYTRIRCNHAFHTGTHQRLFGLQRGHSLALHIRAHQCAVGIIVLKERNQGCRHGYDLLGRHIHVIDFTRLFQRGIAQMPAPNKLFHKFAVVINFGICLRDSKIAFNNGREVFHIIGNLALVDLAVRCFQETIIVGPGVNGQ